MYTYNMESNTLRDILKNYYKNDMVKSIMIGRVKPSYKKMLILNQEHGVPFTAWADLKAYLIPSKRRRGGRRKKKIASTGE